MVPMLNRLRVARAERRVTQIDLARQVGLSPSTLSLIENGYREPSEALRIALAQALHWPTSELFPGRHAEEAVS